MSTTMAPLDTIRQYRLIRLKRRADSRTESLLRKRKDAAGKEATMNLKSEDSTAGGKANDGTLKGNQARADDIEHSKSKKENITDFFPTPPPPGAVISHILDPLAFLHKSTTTSSDPVATPPAVTPPAATPPPTTPDKKTTKSKAATKSKAPPPPLQTSISTTPSSTSISIPPPAVTTPSPPGTTVDNPSTSPPPDVSAAVTAATSSLSSTISVKTSPTSLQYPLDTTSQPRNGYNPGAYSTFATSSTAAGSTTLVSSTTSQQTASGSATTSQALPAGAPHEANTRNGSLSPTAAHALIAAGSIGAFIIVVAAAYFILRMRNIDLFAVFRNRSFRRGDNGWFGWYRNDPDPTDGPPSADIFAYRPDAFPEDVKLPVPPPAPRAKFSPLIVSNVDIPQNVRSPLLAGSQPRQITRRPTIVDATLFEASQQPQGVTRQPTQNTVKEAYTLASTHINNTYETNRGSLARRPSNAYVPTRRELSRMSEQSSLSSGFGDGQIIIPNSPPKPPAARTYPTKNGQVRNFSWVTSVFQAKPAENNNRDTVYTTSSEETTGRYRTVNSWVAQQTRHVEKRQRNDREAPRMPQPPRPR